NDIRKMSKETNAILTNKELIAVNQDPAGIEGFRYSKKDSMEVWVKPLSNEEWAVLFLNRSAKPMKVNFNWKDELIKDTIFNKELNTQQQTYKIRNLWANTSNGDTQKPFTATLSSHDVTVLRLSK
ncbi:MAG: glycoside hydrolase family 27 protein, partial [Ginsengibacter sp.]